MSHADRMKRGLLTFGLSAFFATVGFFASDQGPRWLFVLTYFAVSGTTCYMGYLVIGGINQAFRRPPD